MWAEGPGVAVGSACRDAQAHEPLTAVLPRVCRLSFPSVKEGGQSVLGMRWHRARRSQRGVAQGPCRSAGCRSGGRRVGRPRAAVTMVRVCARSGLAWTAPPERRGGPVSAARPTLVRAATASLSFHFPSLFAPSQRCFDCELIAGWGTCEQKSKPGNFKRTGGRGHRGSAGDGWGPCGCECRSGGFPCFFKGDAGPFRLSLKSSDANLRESRGGTSVSKITLLTFCGQREPRGAPG